MADETSSSLTVAIYRASAADLLVVPEAVVHDGLLEAHFEELPNNRATDQKRAWAPWSTA
jgi:hypothetical protein